jgi:Type I phosphodiesterase / nucleotide pyrophosphatase
MLTEADLPRIALDGESLVKPDFSGRGLANVAPTVLALLAPTAMDTLQLPPLDASVLPRALTTDLKTVLLVVADGLGHLQLQREISAGNAPHLGELIERASHGDAQVNYTPITSVFPTTTVAALGSVNSGVAPVHHGLLGYTLYLPEMDMVAEMIRWGPLNRRVSFADPEYGQAPESFFWAETMYARLHEAGIERTFAVNPIGFAGTSLTRMLHQHAAYAGYVATSSLGPIVSRLIHESTDPTYVYAYWPTVDTIAHVVGPLTPEHSAEVAAFDLQFGRLVTMLRDRPDVLVMLTADHGHVDTLPSDLVSFSDYPELLDMLKVIPAGERRAPYLHARDGAVGEVLAYARERLSTVAAAMLREEAVERGLFGPGELSQRAAGRIGDVLLFPRGNIQMVAPLPETPDGSPPPRMPNFRGLHGGLSPEETLVPLLAVRP